MSHSEEETNLKDKVSCFSLEITCFIVSKWLSIMTHHNESYSYLINTWCRCCYFNIVLSKSQTGGQSEKFHCSSFEKAWWFLIISDFGLQWQKIIFYRPCYDGTWWWRSRVAKTKMSERLIKEDDTQCALMSGDRIWFVTNPKWSPAKKS